MTLKLNDLHVDWSYSVHLNFKGHQVYFRVYFKIRRKIVVAERSADIPKAENYFGKVFKVGKEKTFSYFSSH